MSKKNYVNFFFEYFVRINILRNGTKIFLNRAEELYCDAALFVFRFFIICMPKKEKKMETEKWPRATDSHPLLDVEPLPRLLTHCKDKRNIDCKCIHNIMFFIFSDPGFIFSVCVVCRENSMDTISLPCCHSFACVTCTMRIMQLSVTENADIRCNTCGEKATAFHSIIIIEKLYFFVSNINYYLYC